jgi:hypothetical protein
MPAVNELLQPDKQQLREDVDGVSLYPPFLLGPHELVALHIKERILMFYEPGQQSPFCCALFPEWVEYPAEGLLACPGLEGHLTLEMLRDFRAVVWLFLQGKFDEVFHVP